MAFERPTFHEAWYRVEGLHPRLRSTVQISRQHFRDQTWHVVQDHTNNAFFRLSEPAYRFIGLLDGQRSVGDAWKLCMEQLGDDAPTQGESIQLLGQLYTSNLLMGEIAADTHGLFNRFKRRRQREVQGYLMNLMFIRIPILDPDMFLERWMTLLGWIFSWGGLIVWLGLIGFGFYNISGVANWGDELVKGGRDILAPSNLMLLYIGFALIKACHEFGHAISCKKFGMHSGAGGEVHTIGIMFLVFSPVPYVDASSSWALRSKWQRIIVGAAGMWVELAIASLAAVVWAHTGGNWVHQLAYNMMFVASFSTVVFNANPLLRYDGYYMLSDLLEIPNLAQRAKEYIYYLIKRYAWGVKMVRNPAHSTGEQIWLFFYAFASGIMRIVVSVGILLYLANALQGALIIIAAAMALAGVIGWIIVPTGRFIHYLATSGELARVRARAILSTVTVLGLAVGGLSLVPAPDRARAQGVIEPDIAFMQELNAGWDGFVTSALDTGPRNELGMLRVTAGAPILTMRNETLESQKLQLADDRHRLMTRYNAALGEDPAVAQAYRQLLQSQEEQARVNQERLDSLTVRPTRDGVLIAPKLDTIIGSYLKHGDKIGLVADLSLKNLVVRVAAPNDISGPLRHEAGVRVEIRVLGRPDVLLSGTFGERDILPAGQTELPSPSLGYAAGGQMPVSTEDRRGTKTTEQFFEVRIRDLKFEQQPDDVKELLPGQRVMVRFEMGRKPLIQQAWTGFLQLIQRRFQA